jgi:hypothetical protein
MYIAKTPDFRTKKTLGFPGLDHCIEVTYTSHSTRPPRLYLRFADIGTHTGRFHPVCCDQGIARGVSLRNTKPIVIVSFVSKFLLE